MVAQFNDDALPYPLPELFLSRPKRLPILADHECRLLSILPFLFLYVVHRSTYRQSSAFACSPVAFELSLAWPNRICRYGEPRQRGRIWLSNILGLIRACVPVRTRRDVRQLGS